mmetsp:Transcript_7460/g.11085  ORF Transcript_7460/g.11085 Transcript_7460/m.11085 type:complete len:121 (-) Transcript_7460:654-1016(-)
MCLLDLNLEFTGYFVDELVVDGTWEDASGSVGDTDSPVDRLNLLDMPVCSPALARRILRCFKRRFKLPNAFARDVYICLWVAIMYACLITLWEIQFWDHSRKHLDVATQRTCCTALHISS